MRVERTRVIPDLGQGRSVSHAAWQTQQWLSFGVFRGQIWATKATNASRAARLSHMVARRTSSHQLQRTCARMCVAQNADMLWFPDGSFSRIPRRIFKQIFPNLPVTLQRCPAACRMVPTTTNLCLISHFRLPFHFHTPVDLCARRSRGARECELHERFPFLLVSREMLKSFKAFLSEIKPWITLHAVCV